MVPIPGDFVVGVYYPWLDYKWGYAVGVPVKNPMTTDVVSFTYPMQTLGIDLLKKGELPLWNPYILGGTPLLANFQSAPFSPTNFVYFLTDKLSAWSIQVFLQHFLAAAFTYLLLRHWKASQWGAIFGGIIFAFSGFNLIWSQWNGHTLAASFIPLILLFVDRYLLKGKPLDGVLTSFFFCLLFLSGYPQVALYLGIAIGLLWVIRFSKEREFLSRSVLLGTFLVFGIGLAAFQILPGAELLSLSQRELEPHPFEWAFLPFSKLITFLAPDYFGNHATQNYWGPQDYTSNTGFVGVIAFTLATAGTLLVRKKKEVFYSVLILTASLIFAFPTPVSIFLWKSGLLGFNAASAHRSLVLFNLAVSLLAGFGIDNFIGKKLPLWKILFIPALILAGYALYAFSPGVYHSLVRGIPKDQVAIRNLIFPGGVFLLTFFLLRVRKFWLIPLFLLMCFELFRFGWKFTPFSPRHIVFPQTPVLEFLMSREAPTRVTGSNVTPINMRMPYGLESLEGYDAVYPLRISQLIAAINSGISGTDPVGRYGTVDNVTSPLVDLVNTKYHMTIKRDAKNNPSETGVIPDFYKLPKFKKVFEDKSVAVLESAGALPRAFMVYDWLVRRKETEILDSLLDPKFRFDQTIILEDEIGLERQTGGKFNVSYNKYAENESLLNVETDKKGLLFISDTYYPGWKAFLDGKETKIHRANFAFRAIEIPQGTHQIKFIYRPESFLWGVKISLVSVLVLGGIMVILERRHV